MKDFKIYLFTLIFFISLGGTVIAANDDKDKPKEEDKVVIYDLILNGTSSSSTITVDTQGLLPDQDITLTASPGFEVSPQTLPANSTKAKITITNKSTKNETTGQIILRSGDSRTTLNVKGLGTPLSRKDISKSPIYAGGSEKELIKTIAEGFSPSSKGYTVEFKVKTDNLDKEFKSYMTDSKGYGLKTNITSGDGSFDTGIALYNGPSKISVSNPFTAKEGGRKVFYNNDEKFHTYRFSVTPDNRMFIYRDGLPVDTVRLEDFGPQPNFAEQNGEPVENLLRNSGFEGEYDILGNDKLLGGLAGWHIAITDRWCSEQYIINQELDNEQDFNNQILRLRPYKWAGSWGNPQITQVVDVAPNETYTLSALARGGIRKEGALSGKLIIEELEDGSKKQVTEISSNNFETYSMDYTTSASCKQIRVILEIGGGKWGEDISPLEVDNVKLTGVSRTYSPKIGFENVGAEVEYFTYDLTGAYAPAINPEIKITVK